MIPAWQRAQPGDGYIRDGDEPWLIGPSLSAGPAACAKGVTRGRALPFSPRRDHDRIAEIAPKSVVYS